MKLISIGFGNAVAAGRILANVADMRCTVTRLCQIAAGVSLRW